MGSYTYSGSGPHAVSSITGVNPGTYGYDADGNMTNRNGTAITWNSDNLPTQITQSASNASSFNYAPDKHRYYQSAVINGTTETTVYVGGFEVYTSNGSTIYRHHLMADGREVAEVDLSNGSSGAVMKISYVLTDHLGSTDVVETTDVNNNVLATQYMSFSAWGGRREPNTWLPPVGSSETQADHQADRYGFTHQEMLDNVGIIHMNGRIYDPNLGRFLSVDPVFEFPTNTQSLNPYSYVLNNPLSMTDPTGYVESCGTGKTSCPDNFAPGKTGSIMVKTTATELGSHIATHGTTTFTGTMDKAGNLQVTASGNGFGLGETADVSADRGSGNGAQVTQGATDAQNKPTDTAAIENPSQVSKTEETGTSVTGSGTDDNSDGAKPWYKGDLSLTDDQKQIVLQMAANPYDPASPTEAFQLIRSDNSETDRTSDGCTEASCPAFSNAIQVHWHVDVQDVPDGMTQDQANMTREFPGPDDAALVGYHTIVVGVTPLGAVWSVERENGVIQLDYLKHSSNRSLDNFIQSHWKPGMSNEAIDDLVKKYNP